MWSCGWCFWGPGVCLGLGVVWGLCGYWGVFCVWEVLECGGCLGLGALLPPPAPPFGRGPPSLRCRGDPKAAAPLYFSPLPPPHSNPQLEAQGSEGETGGGVSMAPLHLGTPSPPGGHGVGVTWGG